MAGEAATIGTFSFFPSKNLGGYGDGGMMVTQDDALADAAPPAARARRREDVLSTTRSATTAGSTRCRRRCCSAKLPHLAGVERRSAARTRRTTTRRSPDLADVRTPYVDPANESIFNQYTLRVARRDELQAHLKAKGIGNVDLLSAAAAPAAVLRVPRLQARGSVPESERAAKEVLSLPIFPELTRRAARRGRRRGSRLLRPLSECGSTVSNHRGHRPVTIAQSAHHQSPATHAVNIAVIGTGYVGLVVGACLAETGNDVICADVDAGEDRRAEAERPADLRARPRRLVERNQAAGPAHVHDRRRRGDRARRRRVHRRRHAARRGRLGRPAPRARRRRADRQAHDARAGGRHQVHGAGRDGGEGAPPRSRKHAKLPFHVCSNPEFLKEGAAIDDFMKPDRVVLGVDSDHARSVMAELYAPFVRTGKPIIFMDIPSAEMTKYAANAMLATRISFMNEIANLCERVGADVDLVRKGIGSRRAHRPVVPLPGPGLRRLVLPEGREGARAHGAASAARRCACSRRSRTANERAEAPAVREAARSARRRRRGHAHRGLGARVQAATPTTCARRRRSR